MDSRSLEDIQDESTHLVGLSLASTQRSVKMIEDMTSIGTSTNSKLRDQGDKLITVDATVININTDFDTGKRDVRVISGLGGYIRNFLSKKKSRQPRHAIVDVESHVIPPSMPKSQSITRKMILAKEFSDLGFETEAQMLETEDNLDIIDDGVRVLKEISLEMGNEIDRHNKHLGSLNNDVHRTDVRTRVMSDKVRRQC